jgi:ribosome-associated toxin RatA of RatAB toxin-antitoxin module
LTTVSGEATREVAADLDTCWNLIVDAADYPSWYDTLDEVVIERTDDQGRPRAIVVRSDVGRLGSVRARLELAYRDRASVTAKQVGRGDFIRDLKSEWHFEPLAPARTRVHYRLSATNDGMKAAIAFYAAEALVRRDLVEGFVAALQSRAEALSAPA